MWNTKLGMRDMLAAFDRSSNPDKATDLYVLRHIISGQPFHILSPRYEDPHAGKFVMKDNAIEKYEQQDGLTLTRPHELSAADFLNALFEHRISTQSLKLEGEAEAHEFNRIPFLTLLRSNKFFHMPNNGGIENFRAEIPLAGENAGKWNICRCAPTITLKRTIEITDQPARLSAFAFLKAYKDDSFKFGVENTLVYAQSHKGHTA